MRINNSGSGDVGARCNVVRTKNGVWIYEKAKPFRVVTYNVHKCRGLIAA